MNYRLATETDLPALAAMRWTWRVEEDGSPPVADRAEYLAVCLAFLKQGLADGSWVYWVAEEEGQLISHIFVRRIRKVPKPNRLHDEYGYVTNVYTRPAYRGQGIGAELMKQVTAWAKEEDLEFLIVWPGEESIRFYERAGFAFEAEPVMEYLIRPDVES
jgi:GNAT superfamily N-acetyltransferase